MPKPYQSHHYFFKVAAVVASCASWSAFAPASFAQSQPIQHRLYGSGTSLLAQVSPKPESEADRIFRTGIEQYDRGELDAAFASWQTSVKLYRDSRDRLGEGESIRNIGRVYYVRKDYANALTHFQQSLTIAREVKNRKGEGRSLGNLGVIYNIQKETDKAIEHYKQSIKIAQEVADRFGEAVSQENLALIYNDRKDFNQSLEYFQKNLGIWRELKDRSKESATLTSIGIAYYNLKDYVKSIEFHQQSLELYTGLNDRPGMATTFRNLGLAYQAQRNLPQATALFEKSLAIRRELKDRANEIILLEALGNLAYEQQDPSKAISYYEQNLPVAREAKNLYSEVITLRNLGIVYSGLKQSDENSEKALGYYTESLKVAQKLNDRSEVGKALRSIGILHMDYNRFALAVENFQKSLTIWQEIKDQAMEANLLVNLGNLYATRVGSKNDAYCSSAIGYYEQSLPLLRKLQNPALEGSALVGLGFCYEEANKSQKAIEVLSLGLEIARQTNNPSQQTLALLHLGQANQSIGNLTQARQYTEQGLTLARATQDRSREVLALQNLSHIYAISANHQAAIETQTQRMLVAQKYDIQLISGGFNAVSVNIEQAKTFDWQKAIQKSYQLYRGRLEKLGFPVAQLNLSEANITGFTFHITESLINLGDAYFSSNDHTRALTFYQAALKEDFDKGRSYGLNDIYLLVKVGNTLTKMGRLAEAESMFRLALEYGEVFRTGLGYSTGSPKQKAWTDSQRVMLAERKVEAFQQIQQVLVNQNRSDMALELAEESRARTFVELLSARIAGSQVPDGKNLPTAPKLAEIRQVAKEQNATLVQYSMVSSDRLYIWVIQPNGTISFKSVNLKNASRPIEDLVRQSRRSMGVRSAQAKSNGQPIPSNSSHTKELEELHRLLIEPIGAELPSDPNQRVVFMPQGALFLVPFPALKNAQGKFLIEQHTISTAPSIQTLALTRKQRKSLSTGTVPLIVGNPTMPKSEDLELEPLEGAEQEARSIAQLFNTNALTGGEATKREVLKRITNAPIVHLATHGLLDTIEGDTPGAIVLAPSNQDSGFLSANEIFNLKLNANLVVLSACDTGRGKITGDGVIGLSRSFVAAGVPSIVVSLWAVNDNSTSVLMSAFYRNLKTNPDKATALRQAMLSTMKEHPEPIDWAAFTLIGETQ